MSETVIKSAVFHPAGSHASTERDGDTFIHFLESEGVVDQAKMRALKMLRRSRLYFGVIALRQGFLDPDELTQVLEEQMREPGERIGELLVRHGLLTQEQVREVLKIQCEEGDPPPELYEGLDIVPDELIRGESEKYRLMKGVGISSEVPVQGDDD